MMFLYFHVLSRSIRWSSNPTSSEIPRVDGEPQSAQSWVCVSKKIWSFPAEVGLPWTSLSLLLPPLGFGPTDVWGWGAVLNSKEAALIPDRLIFLREHEAWLLSLSHCSVWIGLLFPRFLLLSIYRYKSLCPETWPTWDGRPHDGVAVLVKHLGYKQEEYKMGRLVLLFS